ncbi:MAG TPA: hypothetical protein VMY59_10225 [Candidatus Thermoplasmatota archaeon]|nr:hypothetical protein [Candidatus Thermoplasmatota archaeon]
MNIREMPWFELPSVCAAESDEHSKPYVFLWKKITGNYKEKTTGIFNLTSLGFITDVDLLKEKITKSNHKT